MPTLTYDEIEPLIERAAIQGSDIAVRFRCSETGFTVESVVSLPSSDSALLLLPREKTRFLRGARVALFGLVRKPVPAPVEPPATISEETRRRGVVAAFRQVRHHFKREEKTRRWVALTPESSNYPLSTEFVEQTRRGPVVSESDRGILLRLLAEIAHSDAQLSGDEKSFLEEFIGIGEEAGEQVLSTGPLTTTDLQRVQDPAVRETMLMLAYGIALTDEELAGSEQDKLRKIASDLDISAQRATELQRYVQLFILEAALEQAVESAATTEERQAQVIQFGERIGLSAEEVMAAMNRFFRAGW